MRLILNDGYPTEAGFKSGMTYTYRNERDDYIEISWRDRYIVSGMRGGKPFASTRESYQLAKEKFRTMRNMIASEGVRHPQVRRRTRNMNFLYVRSSYGDVQSVVRFMPIRQCWQVEKTHPYERFGRIPKVIKTKTETLFDAMCIALGARLW